MINVRVRLYLTLRKYALPGMDQGYCPVVLQNGSTAADLLNHLRIPASEECTVVVNSRIAKKDLTLKNNDQVSVLPPVSGG